MELLCCSEHFATSSTQVSIPFSRVGMKPVELLISVISGRHLRFILKKTAAPRVSMPFCKLLTDARLVLV